MTRSRYPLQIHVQRFLQINKNNGCPWHHQWRNGTIVQTKYIPHHGMFRALNHTGFRALGQHSVDLLLRYTGTGILPDPHQTDQAVSRRRQQKNKRTGDKRQQLHRPGNQTSDFFRTQLTQSFRYQLSHNNRDISHHHHDNNCRCGTAGCSR